MFSFSDIDCDKTDNRPHSWETSDYSVFNPVPDILAWGMRPFNNGPRSHNVNMGKRKRFTRPKQLEYIGMAQTFESSTEAGIIQEHTPNFLCLGAPF